jgi:hypothetical protein
VHIIIDWEFYQFYFPLSYLSGRLIKYYLCTGRSSCCLPSEGCSLKRSGELLLEPFLVYFHMPSFTV